MSGKSQIIGDFVISRPSQTFPPQGDNGRHLPRRVFILSRECLSRSGNKIPDGLGIFPTLKTSLKHARKDKRTKIVTAMIYLPTFYEFISWDFHNFRRLSDNFRRRPKISDVWKKSKNQPHWSVRVRSISV